MNIVFAYIRKKKVNDGIHQENFHKRTDAFIYNDLFKFDFWSHFYDFHFRTFGILIYKVFRRSFVYEREPTVNTLASDVLFNGNNKRPSRHQSIKKNSIQMKMQMPLSLYQTFLCENIRSSSKRRSKK